MGWGKHVSLTCENYFNALNIRSENLVLLVCSCKQLMLDKLYRKEFKNSVEGEYLLWYAAIAKNMILQVMTETRAWPKQQESRDEEIYLQ